LMLLSDMAAGLSPIRHSRESGSPDCLDSGFHGNDEQG
jgi:hypothetical protein